MQYKILDSHFNLDEQNLSINGQFVECTQFTFKSLQLFLESDGKLISKETILEQVWTDVIVSESSAFKQIQLLKKLFASAGLPKDVVENVYGKGYRIKYPIIKDVQLEQTGNAVKKKPQRRMALLLAVLVISVVSLGGLYWSLTSQKEVDFLSQEAKASLSKLMYSNWEHGLQRVEAILNGEKALSRADKAFLYNKKGLCQYHLQQITASLESYQKAYEIYEQLGQDEKLGHLHIYMARDYGELADKAENTQNQLYHINQSIKIFKRLNKPEKVLDSLVERAYYYKGSGRLDEAVVIFKQVIDKAGALGNLERGMIGVSSLASTYRSMDDYKQAISLGKKGLKMALEIGKGRYIASSYAFLGDLYLHEYESVKSMKMIEQSLKFQLASNNRRKLGANLTILNYLLVQTFQFTQAEQLNALGREYYQLDGSKASLSNVLLYHGLNLLRQNHWSEAEQVLTQALELARAVNNKYKYSMKTAYLALALYLNDKYLLAIEPASLVMKDEGSSKESKAVAALVLAYTYQQMENAALAKKWFEQSADLINPKWLFEYQLFLKLKLQKQVSENSIHVEQTKQKIAYLDQQMLNLAEQTRFDPEIYQNFTRQFVDALESLREEALNK